MSGLFDVLNTFISILYPIFATYRAIEGYSKTEQKITSENVNIGGFNVPIQPLLKRATGDTSVSFSEDTSILQGQSIRLQKWLVYWMVTGASLVVQQLLFLRYIIPFFSMVRMLVSTWLLLPLIQPDTAKSEVGQPVQQTQSWQTFSNSGCGYVFQRVLKPALEGELQILSNLPFDSNKLVSLWSSKISSLSFATVSEYIFRGNTESKVDNSSVSYVEGIKSFLLRNVNAQASSSGIKKGTEAGTNEQDEYCVINKPTGDDTLTRRKPQEVEQDAEQEGKKGFFW